MATATLNIQPLPDHDARRYVIDCEHGKTTVWSINPAASGQTDADAVLIALDTHASEQPTCRCIAGLWRRYGKDTES